MGSGYGKVVLLVEHLIPCERRGVAVWLVHI